MQIKTKKRLQICASQSTKPCLQAKFPYMVKGCVQVKHEKIITWKGMNGQEQDFKGSYYKRNGEERANEIILYCIMV